MHSAATGIERAQQKLKMVTDGVPWDCNGVSKPMIEVVVARSGILRTVTEEYSHLGCNTSWLDRGCPCDMPLAWPTSEMWRQKRRIYLRHQYASADCIPLHPRGQHCFVFIMHSECYKHIQTLNCCSFDAQGYKCELQSSEMQSLVPPALVGKADVLFGNLEEIFSFHSKVFLRDLENCILNTELVALCFTQRVRALRLAVL
jgi:hypothetical protein